MQKGERERKKEIVEKGTNKDYDDGVERESGRVRERER